MTKIDDTLLMKYMRGLCSAEEKEAIARWTEESEENQRTFTEAHLLYESILMSVDPETLVAPSKKVAAGSRANAFRRTKGRRRLLSWTLAAAAAIAVAVISAFAAVHFTRTSISDERITVDIPAGKMMTITLADGTRVDLNSGARFTYPALFLGGERNVELEGEAMFHVVHDPDHPFTVGTYAADVTVLGTQFSVNADSGEKFFSTSLVEGKVRVTSATDPSESHTLTANQTIILDGGRFRIEDALDPQTLYWTEGLVNIAGMTFPDLMKRFEKAFGVNIVIACKEMPSIDCTSGEVRISDGIDNALRVLRHVSDFDYEKDPSTGTITIR